MIVSLPTPVIKRIFKATVESLEQHCTPECLRDAKFGICSKKVNWELHMGVYGIELLE